MEDGVFLVRDSVHFQGDFTLSVSFEGKVDHYRILFLNNKLEVDGGDCQFDNLLELVEVCFLMGYLPLHMELSALAVTE